MDTPSPPTIDADLRRLLLQSRVDLPGTTNLRDLGGYPTRNGRVVRPGALYRAEALAIPGPGVARVALWRDELLKEYRRLGLALVIDLRPEQESALPPSAWAWATDAVLLAIPINEGGEGDATDYVRRLREGTLRSFSAEDLAEYYRTTLRRRARQFGLAIEALAGAGATPALVHCAAGKDRTGLLIALVLEALGVSREIVVADYALTGAFRPNRVAAYADVLAAGGIAPEDVSALFETPADAMQLVLDGLDRDHGSVQAFLLGPAGLDEHALRRLAGALLTDPPSGPVAVA